MGVISTKQKIAVLAPPIATIEAGVKYGKRLFLYSCYIWSADQDIILFDTSVNSFGVGNFSFYFKDGEQAENKKPIFLCKNNLHRKFKKKQRSLVQ